ncbi:FAD dependent oxidoreductase-domain-containing protein [Aspergillus taichungensis]|uniref:FAD dependent oxidoreductase-domain-containing protein n=1 Tax=Aspergillus taichungensis TaxID=482145 RepID=A0A2J5HI86_9EURO|nr:FAD dependent oxidoreductase-domain-containing protein [Aspergillus taichungensis]
MRDSYIPGQTAWHWTGFCSVDLDKYSGILDIIPTMSVMTSPLVSIASFSTVRPTTRLPVAKSSYPPENRVSSAFQVANPLHIRSKATMAPDQHFLDTSGETDPVWVLQVPYSAHPQFPRLDRDIEADVCIVGAGIAGVSIAYELVNRGTNVTLLEARHTLSGESGRTSGHLSNALDDGYVEIAKKHGKDHARIAAESHTWALNRVGEISKQLNIECEYRYLPGYEISQYTRDQPQHQTEIESLKHEFEMAKGLGLPVAFRDDLKVRGWDGSLDQQGGTIFEKQATFHPTKYLVGVLNWLKNQPNFNCFAETRVISMTEEGHEILGFGNERVTISTESGHKVTAKQAVQATCVPLQKLAVIAQMEYDRTYCIAIRVPKGYVEDCLLYDQAEQYKYLRLTECDQENDYLVVGGCDHKVGQEDTSGRFEELEEWVRKRFTKAGSVDYKWSGQIYEPVDYMAYIGKNQASKHTYIVTGDSGNGLTHGVLAGKLIADELTGKQNAWSQLYDPGRKVSVAKSLPAMLGHDLEINAQYKRFLQSDITDIEDLAPGTGGVLNKHLQKPIAVYKDEHGQVHQRSALCPHMKGVICWNDTEKSWDCPVHGSRFSKEGICVEGPSKANLQPV